MEFWRWLGIVVMGVAILLASLALLSVLRNM